MAVANANFVAASELTAGLADPTNKIYNELNPDGFQAATADRNSSTANSGILVSGREHATLIWLNAGTKITRIVFFSGSQAIATPTNQWFALRNLNRQLLAITTDDTTTAWNANSEKSLPLTATYTVPYSGYYYVTIMTAATTPPSLTSVTFNMTAIINKPPIASGADTVNTGLTTPATAPATLAALTATASLPYVGVT